MAVLRSMVFDAHGWLDALNLTVPPVHEVDPLWGPHYDGYITGVAGTEFLPQNMITTPKAFGGSHFHGFNVIDREVSVTFHPLSGVEPSALRDRVNRMSQANKMSGHYGRLQFEVSPSYGDDEDAIFLGNKAEISDFEFDSFKGSTECKLVFKMPDPYFLTAKKEDNSIQPILFVRDSRYGILFADNVNYINNIDAGVRGELLYDIFITLGPIKKGQTIHFSRNKSYREYIPEDDFVVQFLTDRPKGEYIRIYKDDVLRYGIKSSIPRSSYLTLGRPPTILQNMGATPGAISSSYDDLISTVKLKSYAIAVEGF